MHSYIASRRDILEAISEVEKYYGEIEDWLNHRGGTLREDNCFQLAKNFLLGFKLEVQNHKEDDDG